MEIDRIASAYARIAAHLGAASLSAEIRDRPPAGDPWERLAAGAVAIGPVADRPEIREAARSLFAECLLDGRLPAVLRQPLDRIDGSLQPPPIRARLRRCRLLEAPDHVDDFGALEEIDGGHRVVHVWAGGIREIASGAEAWIDKLADATCLGLSRDAVRRTLHAYVEAAQLERYCVIAADPDLDGAVAALIAALGDDRGPEGAVETLLRTIGARFGADRLAIVPRRGGEGGAFRGTGAALVDRAQPLAEAIGDAPFELSLPGARGACLIVWGGLSAHRIQHLDSLVLEHKERLRQRVYIGPSPARQREGAALRQRLALGDIATLRTALEGFASATGARRFGLDCGGRIDGGLNPRKLARKAASVQGLLAAGTSVEVFAEGAASREGATPGWQEI